MHLVDYKVRILDGESATGARTRVLIESSGPMGTLGDGRLAHEHHCRLGRGPDRFPGVRPVEGRRPPGPP